MTTYKNQEELRELLRNGKVKFEFPKNDGTLREAFGTLFPKYIPLEFQLKDSSRNIHTLRYFDLEKNAWRSISESTQVIKVYDHVIIKKEM